MALKKDIVCLERMTVSLNFVTVYKKSYIVY